MVNINKKLDYVMIASLFESENLNIKIGYKNEKNLKNFFLINEFLYNEKNANEFKMLFDIFFSKNRPKEFVDFFVENEKLYTVFKYCEEEGIKQKFSRYFNVTHFDERCTILENILIYIDKIYRFPRCILGCITELENIKIDKEKTIHYNYDLRNIEKYKDDSTSMSLICKNIANIITTILELESKAKFNKELHIVIDKCKNGVYLSIPELVIDLKRAEKLSKTNTWLSYFKYQISLRKNEISKFTKTGISLIIVAGVVYMINNKLNEGKGSGTAPTLVSIGGINYTGDKEDDSNKTVSAENIDNQTGETMTPNIVLSEGLDIQFEDYIVQHGDTIKSICENYYKDTKYLTAVASFNGIDVNEKLSAGTILKLPNRTAVALYTSK